MKIISWNLKNVGQTKLGTAFSPTFTSFGLGNTVLDYVTRLVMGAPQWNVTPNLSSNPADLFVVIELKSGGHQKGTAVSGTCIPTIAAITAEMNMAAQLRYAPAASPYAYTYVTPTLTGYHETVGLIFNTRSLALTGARPERDDTSKRWINPRTPYVAQFMINATGVKFQVVGIHAPPPKGSNAQRFRPPIDFCRRLPAISTASLANTLFMGDFNCDPTDSYTSGAGINYQPFTGLPTVAGAYTTNIAAGTLSSVRRRLSRTMAPPANYLSGAYDNIIFNNANPAMATETVIDLIGNARNMSLPAMPNISATNTVALLNAYNQVSDHMPVAIEW